METIEIKVALLRAGVTQTKIAKQTGVAPSIVNRVIQGKVVSRHVAQAVADSIGLRLEEVFPKYLDCPDARRSACN